MHLSRVEIKNFRNFKHLNLALGANAVIIGPNRVGKSNLLHALRLVLDPTLPDSARYLRAEDFYDGLPQPFQGETVSVSLEIFDFDTNVEAKALLQDALVQLNPAIARITYEFHPKQNIVPTQAKPADYTYVLFPGTHSQRWVSPDLRKYISVMLLPALRDVESDLQSWRRSPLRPLLERLHLNDQNVQKILEDLNKATGTLLDEDSFQTLSGEMTRRLEEMVGLPQSTDTRLGFASTKAEHILRTIRLFVDGDKSRPLNDASLGTANILYLVLLLQDLQERQDTKETVVTTLAIEEPEAHLHPHVQRLVFRYFLNQHTPVIVSTHSAHIASVTPLDAMVMLKAHPTDGAQAYTIHGLGLSTADKADLQRYLDVTRAEMLFARGVILVEGVAEQFLVPAFAKLMSIDLDRLGISICSVNGTDFKPYYKLLSKSGFDIPCAVLTDGDPIQQDDGLILGGLDRGQKLIPDGPESANVLTEIQNANWVAAQQLLAQLGIFVGQATLELDSLDTLDQVMLRTYADFSSALKTTRFSEALVGAKAGNEDSKHEIIRRIEEIGKGRFAQRMVANIVAEEPPAYIKAAIEWIGSKV